MGCADEDDAGRSLVTSLVAERVAVEHVTRDHAAATGSVILLRNEVGEKQVIVVPSANAALTLDAVEAAAQLLAAALVVLVQFEIPLSVVLQDADELLHARQSHVELVGKIGDRSVRTIAIRASPR